MQCMKCGRKIKDNQVFCEECLGIMETYPVKPGTPIQLPPPSKTSLPTRPNRRKTLKPEEQIQRLRSTVGRLTIALILLILILIIVSVMLFWLLDTTNMTFLAAQLPQLF